MIAAASRGSQISEIGRHSAKPHNARLLIEISHRLRQSHIIFIRQKLDDSGIEVARSRSHRNAAERSETHGRIHTLTALNRRNRRAVTEVHSNNLKIRVVFSAEILSRFCGNESVARSVETVSSYLIIGVRFVRDTVDVSLFGHSVVESRIENPYHWDVRHYSLTSPYPDNVRGLMKRSEFGKTFDSLHNIFS
ncbi:cAMP-binding protein [Acidiphilium sp. CAG:727]|nr:cAMP-binding protein [Acidiphilium sp. CAG:727]